MHEKEGGGGTSHAGCPDGRVQRTPRVESPKSLLFEDVQFSLKRYLILTPLTDAVLPLIALERLARRAHAGVVRLRAGGVLSVDADIERSRGGGGAHPRSGGVVERGAEGVGTSAAAAAPICLEIGVWVKTN